MASKLEVPLPQKNPWEKFSFRIVLSENVKESIELCLNMIFMAANNPVEALEDNTETREIARAQCNASVIHQADKLLRYIVVMSIMNKVFCFWAGVNIFIKNQKFYHITPKFLKIGNLT